MVAAHDREHGLQRIYTYAGEIGQAGGEANDTGRVDDVTKIDDADGGVVDHDVVVISVVVDHLGWQFIQAGQEVFHEVIKNFTARLGEVFVRHEVEMLPQ